MQGIDVRLTTRGEAAGEDMAAAELAMHAVWLLRHAIILDLSGRVSIVTLSWRGSPSFSRDGAAAAMVAVAKLVALAIVVAVVVASVVVLADGAASVSVLASAAATAALGARGALPPPRGEYDLAAQYVDAATSARACEEGI